MKNKTIQIIVAVIIFSFSLAIVHADVSGILFTKTLQKGATGAEVSRLQEVLKQFPDVYPNGSVTGLFGTLTENAVKKFQKKEGLDTVGIVGKKTRDKLNEIITKKNIPVLPVANAVNPTDSVGTIGSGKNSTSSVQAVLPIQVASVGLPVRLKIPNINVDAPITYSGIDPDGEMEAPVGPTNVGWFQFGIRPGEVGSAVIAGHYGHWKAGGGSVFDFLNTLVKGDKIYVVDDKGATVTFVVQKLQRFGKNDDGSTVFGSSDGKAHLNLITCEGVWDPTQKTYSNRLVVFADKL